MWTFRENVRILMNKVVSKMASCEQFCEQFCAKGHMFLTEASSYLPERPRLSPAHPNGCLCVTIAIWTLSPRFLNMPSDLPHSPQMCAPHPFWITRTSQKALRFRYYVYVCTIQAPCCGNVTFRNNSDMLPIWWALRCFLLVRPFSWSTVCY